MTDKQWLEHYDNKLPSFRWFIQEYFKPDVINLLVVLREREHITMIVDILNNIWFHLPDSKFNVIENPKGWEDFLFLLENPPNYTEIEIPNLKN